LNRTLIRIGLISDTHNLVRPEAKRALAGVDRILHAGDICGPRVLDELGEIAPVVAVRGNNDRGPWANSIRAAEAIEIGRVSIYILHDLGEIDLDPKSAGFRVVISGHSHRPAIHDRDGVLYINPGSAGPRRFTLPVSLAILEIADGGVQAQLRTLENPKPSVSGFRRP
jgi:putative phosphoesterase